MRKEETPKWDSEQSPERIEFALDGASYTITRGKDSRRYLCATPEEKAAYKADMERRGYREVREKRLRGWAVYYVPNAWRQA